MQGYIAAMRGCTAAMSQNVAASFAYDATLFRYVAAVQRCWMSPFDRRKSLFRYNAAMQRNIAAMSAYIAAR